MRNSRKRKGVSDMEGFDYSQYGKIPPQDTATEKSILGAIMEDNDSLDVVTEYLNRDCFYREAHQLIFDSFISLRNKSISIDSRTVSDELRRTESLDVVGGEHYLSELVGAAILGPRVEHYSKIVFERFLKRQLIQLGGEMITEGYQDSNDAFDLLDTVERKFTEITLKRVGSKIPSLDTLLIERFQRINELRKNESHITGISSGFFSIDRYTHGWQNQDLIILAARPSVGKTALAVQIAKNATQNKIRRVSVALFSLEMSKGQLTDRILSCESEIYLEKITNGQMDDDNMRQLYEKGLQPLSRSQLFIDDTPALDVFELRAKCRRLKRKYNIELILIDYLQLMSGKHEDSRGSNREQEIGFISRSLKALAKELNVAVIALSQLSREPEKRKGELKAPQLSDMRESGAIEQDADVVMSMYRPEYYDENHNEMGESTIGETHISILKHRNGKLAKGKNVIKLRADLGIQKFYEWDNLAEVKKELGSGKWRPVTESRNDLL